jgi:DNA primase
LRNPEMDEFVERVKQASDIVQVVAQYVPLKRRGSDFWGCCPFHQEDSPSFHVSPDKGFFYCFGCHAGGDVFKFLSLIENISYFDAIKLQAEKLGIPVPSRPKSRAELQKDQQLQDLRKVNELAKTFFHNCLTVTRYGEAGRRYFAARGISPETIEEFSLGFAPDAWGKLSDAFLARGISERLLLESGLSAQRKSGSGLYDRFRNRVIIPIADERGHVVGFGGRVLDDSKPKYLNTPETVLFNKRKLLFGLDRSHRAIAQKGYVIIVEGYMDAISVFGAGVRNVVASLGTSFTAEHGKKLLRYTPNLYFCYDSDEAGQKATIRALSIVRDTGANVKVIVVPDGKDPDEFVRKHGAEAFQALTQQAQPLVDYRLGYVMKHVRYETLEGKVQALQEMLPVLTGIRSEAERSEYIKKVASALMLDEGSVMEEVARAAHHPEWNRDEVGPVKPAQPRRRAVYQADSAERKAARAVIRAIWKDPARLPHAEALVPFDEVDDEVEREVLLYLRQAAGENYSAVSAQQALSEEANEELSRALVESGAASATAEAEDKVYLDSLKSLRIIYLTRIKNEKSRKAENMADPKGRLSLISEVQQIDNEIRQLRIS